MSTYLVQFEAAACSNGWTSLEKAALTVVLRDNTDEILQPLPFGNYIV